ncbi:MAG: DUF559 domain-containing protein [Anaerolineales bacterium]|nr:DUF559 domain-containing protein [Anaerolineales bacterium]
MPAPLPLPRPGPARGQHHRLGAGAVQSAVSTLTPNPSPFGRGGLFLSPRGRGAGDKTLFLPSPRGRGAGGEGHYFINNPTLNHPPTTHPKRKPPLPPALKARARELRRNATDAEKLLWQLLRNRQLAGAKFRRQYPLGGFILDFYCHEARLALELDGSQHAQPEQAQYDAARTQALTAEGIRVLRFWNNEVLQQTESVLEAIWEAVANQVRSPSPLTPLPKGEGDSDSSPPSGGKREIKPSSSPLPAGEGPGVRAITKLDIFHYVYAVLHDPAYRHKYELNLKREFPRLPFYTDFWQWAEWGRRLLDLHLHYETAPPYPLERLDKDPAGVSQPYKAKLKAVKTLNLIELDSLTTLAGIPPAAWEYRLGNRSALEWVLDRYKESAPGDPTIRAKFNTYRFLDYKESVIDLLQRVCTVSVETMQIVGEMKLEH